VSKFCLQQIKLTSAQNTPKYVYTEMNVSLSNIFDPMKIRRIATFGVSDIWIFIARVMFLHNVFVV